MFLDLRELAAPTTYGASHYTNVNLFYGRQQDQKGKVQYTLQKENSSNELLTSYKGGFHFTNINSIKDDST